MISTPSIYQGNTPERVAMLFISDNHYVLCGQVS